MGIRDRCGERVELEQDMVDWSWWRVAAEHEEGRRAG